MSTREELKRLEAEYTKVFFDTSKKDGLLEETLIKLREVNNAREGLIEALSCLESKLSEAERLLATKTEDFENLKADFAKRELWFEAQLKHEQLKLEEIGIIYHVLECELRQKGTPKSGTKFEEGPRPRRGSMKSDTEISVLCGHYSQLGLKQKDSKANFGLIQNDKPDKEQTNEICIEERICSIKGNTKPQSKFGQTKKRGSCEVQKTLHCKWYHLCHRLLDVSSKICKELDKP